jgi:outer membrane protein assembly factor BamA
MTLAVSAAMVDSLTLSNRGSDSLNKVSAGPLIIKHLFFAGNKVTKADIIAIYLKIDTGSVYDSSELKAAKARLMATNLFIKATILTVRKSDGIDLYVIVQEPVYIGLPALDLNPFSRRYNVPGTWYCPLFGMEFNNLRGRMETLRFSVRLWQWRSLAVSWSKPFLPSPYFFGIGAAADRRPDNTKCFDRLEYSASATLGRKVFEHSKVYCSIIPDYQEKRDFDSITMRPVDTSRYRYAFGAIGWYTDRRSSAYDPSHGWSFFFETRSNYLYHEEFDFGYVQFVSDVKYYHPFLFNNDKIACHASLVGRTNDAGIQNRLTLGGVSAVRGYGSGGIDLGSSASELFLFSGEYRFLVWRVPFLTRLIPHKISKITSTYVCDISDLSPHIDGALFFDYGRVAKNFGSLASLNGPGYISGTDAGFGLRLMEPKLRASGCLDFICRQNPYMNEIEIGYLAYLNLPF